MGYPPCHPYTKPKSVWARGGVLGKNPSPTSAKDKAKIEYISGGQLSPHELAFGVKLGLNSYSKNLR